MPRLPQYQNDDVAFQQMQSTWTTYLDPLLSNPANKGILLKSVSLLSGDNTINHLLGQKLQGWMIVRQRAAATFFDKQDNNSMPDKTLILNASAPVVVDLEVF